MREPTFNSPVNVMEYLSRQSREGKIILFCGAGISIKEPSKLPSVDVIVCSILENIMETVPELGEDILAGSYIFRTSPFELFMSVIQQGLLFRVFEVLEPLLGGSPNSIHYYITKLLVERKVRHIITTNFDDMLESAMASHLSEIQLFYSWQEVDDLEKNFLVPSIIKPHGSFFDKGGNDIAIHTILTTTENIYNSSRESIIRKWARLIDGYTLVFLGYSGRDRLDVIPMLSHLEHSDIVWICHTDDQVMKISSDVDDLFSKEIKVLMNSGINITPLFCQTESFLSVLGEYLGSIYDRNFVGTTNSRNNYSLTVKGAGSLPPIFPKYSYLVAGYLLWWLGFARQAGYAFSEFQKHCVDEEPRLLSNASSALGQVFENLGELIDADTNYRIALRGFRGLGDYPSIVKTQCYYSELLMNMKKYDEAKNLIDDSIILSEREEYESGLSLAHYMKARYFEDIGKLSEAAGLYSYAVRCSEKSGDFWVEAGSRQQLVKINHIMSGKYTEDSIQEIVSALDKIFWIGNGSAPSLKTGAMVDPFFLTDALIDSIIQVKGKEALRFLDLDHRFDRLSGQLPTDVRIRVKQRLGD